MGNYIPSVSCPQFRHQRNSLSDDSVETDLLFCFFVKLGGDAPILWEVDKKNSVDIYMILRGSSFRMGPTIILFHMSCRLGCGGCQTYRNTA